MELIVQIKSREALDAALSAGVGSITVDLPWNADQAWWTEAAAWQAAARRRGVKFYLQWDRLIREEELPQAQADLNHAAALHPDALIIRDLGLARQARERYPDLTLHAAGGLGFHNSPGLRLAETLGFRRVVLAGPVPLKDLALLRRQSAMPLEVVLLPPCPGFGHLCLFHEYQGSGCPTGCHSSGGQAESGDGLLAALEQLSSLSSLGVAAARLGAVISPARSLSRLIELCRLVGEAAPAERPRLLATARDILAAFGPEFRLEFSSREAALMPRTVGAFAAGPVASRRPRTAPPPPRIWLEVRDYREAALLAREWREPLILSLTPENYAAFLGQYRRWRPPRLVWRLPAVIGEETLPFWRTALATLKQGGFDRLVAGDWGAVALAREAGAQVYGEQTLGVRNSLALTVARELGLFRVCLPPGRGPDDWQALVQAAPRGSFWSYLYHRPALTVCLRSAKDLPSEELGRAGEKLRWLADGEAALLSPEAPEHLDHCRDWFESRWVVPLVVSLVHSLLPYGRVPDQARPPKPPPRSPAGPGPRPPRPLRRKPAPPPKPGGGRRS